MNYLVAVDTFFPDRPSGSARVAWDIAQVMRDHADNVTIFCRKQKPDAEDVSEHDGVRVVRFAFPKTMALDPFKVHKQKMAGIKVAGKYLTDTKWDLIHVHIPLYGDIAYEIFGQGPRYVYTVHSPAIMEQEVNWAAQGLAGKIKMLFGKGSLRKLEGGVLRRADAIQTLSEFAKQAIDEYHGVGDKITVIPHWCREGFLRQHSKAQARNKLSWEQDAKILFTIRRLTPRMGIDIAIKAVSPLLKAHSDLYFAIAGAGALEKSLKQLVKSLSVKDKIWFLGRISDDKLKSCYEGADLFILPTQSLECFGLIVLEALAYGLPIISTDAGALPELVNPILPQCVVPAGKIEPMREKISNWVDGSLNLPSSESLVEYVNKSFSRSVIVEKLMTLFC